MVRLSALINTWRNNSGELLSFGHESFAVISANLVDRAVSLRAVNGHLVFILTFKEQSGNWRKVQFGHNGKALDGYVYNSRLIPIAHYDSIPLQNIIDNTGTFSCDSVKVIVATRKFDKSKYRFTYDKQNSSQISAINGKEYWGTDGDLPKREYKSIVIFVGARKITLPPEAFVGFLISLPGCLNFSAPSGI
jgi:hypothetical protein